MMCEGWLRVLVRIDGIGTPILYVYGVLTVYALLFIYYRQYYDDYRVI